MPLCWKHKLSFILSFLVTNTSILKVFKFKSSIVYKCHYKIHSRKGMVTCAISKHSFKLLCEPVQKFLKSRISRGHCYTTPIYYTEHSTSTHQRHFHTHVYCCTLYNSKEIKQIIQHLFNLSRVFGCVYLKIGNWEMDRDQWKRGKWWIKKGKLWRMNNAKIHDITKR